MELNEKHFELLFGAWVAHQDGGGGIVIEDTAYPDADALAQQGWLRRGFVGDELGWFWTNEADVALNISALVEDAKGNTN